MKMELKKIIALVLVATASLVALAQPGEPPMEGKGKEKMEALKRAYYTEKLELTSAEAEKFWPVYNEYDAKKDAARKEMRKAIKKSESDSVTTKEATATIDLVSLKRKEEVDLDSKFLKDCLPILGAPRTMQLSKLDREFQKQVMEKLQEKREERKANRPPGGPRQGQGPRKG